MLDKLKQRAGIIERETTALYFAFRDTRTPWYARVVAALVLAYAFSPVDLIPDFIPVLGYLDDLILVPAGIALVVKLIPPEVMAGARLTASSKDPKKSVGWIGAAVIILVWLGIAAWAILSGIRMIQEKP